MLSPLFLKTETSVYFTLKQLSYFVAAGEAGSAQAPEQKNKLLPGKRQQSMNLFLESGHGHRPGRLSGTGYGPKLFAGKWSGIGTIVPGRSCSLTGCGCTNQP